MSTNEPETEPEPEAGVTVSASDFEFLVRTARPRAESLHPDLVRRLDTIEKTAKIGPGESFGLREWLDR